MKAVAGDLPSDDEHYAYEIKWDGMRIVSFVDEAGGVRLQSANLRDVTVSFPELHNLAQATDGRPAVLDGEVVALDEAGRPSFGQLQQRMHLISPREVAVRAAEVPVVYQIFDLLGFDGSDAMPLQYLDRRRLLSEVITAGTGWSVPRHYVGGGRELLDSVDRMGLEGIIAKRLDSRYEPGRRSRAWTKVKVRRRQEFVVGGWAQGEGRREGMLGSLLIGYYDDSGDLRYAGRVGTGFTEAELQRLGSLLAPLARETSPFTPLPPAMHRRGARWVEPEVVAEVAYGEWTGDKLLRHPAYLGQRTDKSAREVTRDP